MGQNFTSSDFWPRILDWERQNWSKTNQGNGVVHGFPALFLKYLPIQSVISEQWYKGRNKQRGEGCWQNYYLFGHQQNFSLPSGLKDAASAPKAKDSQNSNNGSPQLSSEFWQNETLVSSLLGNQVELKNLSLSVPNSAAVTSNPLLVVCVIIKPSMLQKMCHSFACWRSPRVIPGLFNLEDSQTKQKVVSNIFSLWFWRATSC